MYVFLTNLTSYPYGVSVDSNGEIWIAELGSNRLRKVLTNGTIVTIAGTGTSSYTNYKDNVQANLVNVSPIRVFSTSPGEVFISDNMRLRRISTSTGIITTVAGIGGSTFSGGMYD